MRRGNVASALQYVPELTWILFLRILDETEDREEQEADAVGAPYTLVAQEALPLEGLGCAARTRRREAEQAQGTRRRIGHRRVHELRERRADPAPEEAEGAGRAPRRGRR